MKNSIFFTIVMVIAIVISSYIYFGVFGSAPDKTLLHHLFKGGPLVIALITLTIMVVTFVFERVFVLSKAGGKGSMPKFLKNLQSSLSSGDIDQAIQHCDRQRGTCANVVKIALEKYESVKASSSENEKKMAEVQKSVDEAMMLEVPLLEKNLIAMSTIASIATMVGLLGTTIGMIRAFTALAQAGAPDAIALSQGISEALVNTAGGLICAIIGIVSYNFFVNKVDAFTYMIDEATFSIVQSLSAKK